MRKRIISFFLSLSLISSVPISISAKSLDTTKSLGKVQVIEKLNDLSEGKLKLSAKDGQTFISGKLSEKQVPGEKAATKFLEDNKVLFGIDSATKDLKIKDVKNDPNGDTYVKYVQVINGVEVKDNLINVHFNKDGVIASVNGKLEKNKTITRLASTSISDQEAINIAKKQYTYKSLRNTPKAEKLILAKGGKNYEVYKINISYMEPKIENYDVYVEAHSGKVVLSETNLRYDGVATGTGTDVFGKSRSLNLYQAGSTYYMYDKTKTVPTEIKTYKYDNVAQSGTLVSNSTTSFGTEDYKASVSAHYNAGKVVDFYKNLFSRNSIDGNGMTINSFTHYGTQYNNAFWDGQEMVYGDGDGTTFTYLSGDLDVVGHEMTHGVISNTANLSYHNQSGALNESLADTFGVLIATYDKYNVANGGTWTFNPADWVVGEGIYTPKTPGDALRSLANPKLYGQPDNFTNYEYYPDTENGDWGGVHENSGITNKAAFLIAQSVGMDTTAKIYYKALTNYMYANTDFSDARNCLVEAATDLYGDGSSQVTAVNNAFDSVGINQASNPGGPSDPSGGTDTYEPNDTMDQAKSIEIGTTYQSYISQFQDKDYYKFTLSAPGFIHVKLSDLPKDYDIYLYDSNGNEVGSSSSWDNEDENIDYYASEAGDYYVLVDSIVESDAYNPYSLIVTKPVEGISLNKTSATLKETDKLSLLPTFDPVDASNQNVTWTSSNSSVAKVDTSGNVTPVANGTTVITVTAVDGGYKATCAVTVNGFFAPTTINAVSSAYNGINVSWGAVSGANGYEVYRSNSSTGTYSYVATTTSTSYNNIGLLTNSAYFYKVRAYKLVGTNKIYSNFSTVASAAPIPAIPTTPKAISSSYNSIYTSWGAVAGASGYEIYRATSSTGTYSYLVSTTATAFNNISLATNSMYYYKVRAYTLVGTSKVYGGFSTVVSAKPIPAAPAAPKAISSSYNSIYTSWSAVGGASGYEVYRATSLTGTYSYLVSTTATGFNNINLATNSMYYYKVRAYTLVGTSKIYSDFSTVVSAKPIPATPVAKITSFGYNSIYTSWSAVAGASGYELYRATTSTGTYGLVSTTTGTSFVNVGLVTNAPYYYKVRAYKLVGTIKVYGDFSAVVNARPIPAVPTNLTVARYTSTSARLNWSAVSGANGYEVYRATTSTGTYALILTTTGLSNINSGLVSGRTYYYKIRVYRLVGTVKVYSGFTSIVNTKI